jgi:hypothetical protein
LAVEIWDGSAWTQVDNNSNSGSIPWTTKSISISQYADQDIKIRLDAWGADSYNINNWNVDNISVMASSGGSGYNPCVIGYNVYLNTVLIAFTPDTTYLIPPSLVQYGMTYDACVNAVYGSGYSTESCYTFTSHFLYPPTNLQIEGVECAAYLTWDQPAVTDGPGDDQSYVSPTQVQDPMDLSPGDGVSGLPPVVTSLSNFSDATYDNGGLVNSPGTGVGGADESILEAGLTLYGSNVSQSAGYSLADDFVVPPGGGWPVSKFTFFAYQTGSSTTSTFTGLFVRIWDGPPNAGGSVIWGDLTTNIMTATSWSNIYRNNNGPGGSTDRPIMKLEANISGLTLSPGTYWIEYQTTGTAASGPWGPPITISGLQTTGNAIQWQGSSWAAMVSGVYNQGIPFLIDYSGGGGTIQGLLGYNVYRDGSFIKLVTDKDTT